MLQNNKGSILVTTLMVFSIIITVCVGCIGIVYSNINYSKLEYEHIKMKELALSGIEVVRSNIYKEVNYAMTEFTNEEEYSGYFLGNNSNIVDINKSGLKNVRVSIDSEIKKMEDGSLNFKLLSSCRDGEYSKGVTASVKIKNPWREAQKNNVEENSDDMESHNAGINIDDLDLKNDNNNIDVNNEEMDSNLNIENNQEESDGNIEEIKPEFSEKDLVIIYNYWER